ncbi:MAG: hypothetical protein G01um10148_483 [Parcubacteria group bacterium Gr01-1014_8]|nr:MAG: hypothetical protein G01um10148_483 [Parcubacteria group bacterium Gr01-1014_8]
MLVACKELTAGVVSFRMATTTISAVTPISGSDLVRWQLDLIHQLNTASLEHIGFAITVVLALGGIFYLMSLRPIEKELEKQSSSIVDARQALESQVTSSVTALRAEIGALSNEIREDTKLLIKKSEEDILAKSSATTALALSKEKGEMIEEIRAVDEKISKLTTASVSQQKDVASQGATQNRQQLTITDLEMRIRELETYMYSKEGRMGAILIPLRTIKETMGTPGEWRIPRCLETLKEEVFPGMKAETMAEVREVLDQLPAKFKDTVEEILLKMKKPKATDK